MDTSKGIGSKRNRGKPQTAHRDDIPIWLRDNEYILSGHPLPTYPYRKSYRLWLTLHMETMNIWTHALGCAALVIVGLALLAYSMILQDHAAIHAAPMFRMPIATTTICFGLSATFHTLRSHSYETHVFWGKMDILGICVLAPGRSSLIYYALYGQPRVQSIYWTLILCSSASAA